MNYKNVNKNLQSNDKTSDKGFKTPNTSKKVTKGSQIPTKIKRFKPTMQKTWRTIKDEATRDFLLQLTFTSYLFNTLWFEMLICDKSFGDRYTMYLSEPLEESSSISVFLLFHLLSFQSSILNLSQKKVTALLILKL